MTVSALIVDDERNIRQTLSTCLESIGCSVVAVPSAAAAREASARGAFDVAFVDLRLGTDNGMALLPDLLAEHPNLAIIIITAYSTIDTAVEAMRRGAWDYLPKPFVPAQIRHLIDRLQTQAALQHRLAALESTIRSEVPEVDFDTRAPAMRAVLDTIARAATADTTVLLRGESGTGKGVLARALHAQSSRAAQPFVVVNCPTLSEDLLASELFGHARGSFTGAVRDQVGRVEAAQGGTLFLDEIGEIPPVLQAKLLRFLQEKRFERLGDNRTREADVRVVAATNRELEADVKSGRFREDLLFRLNVIEIQAPPLRERRDDILPLARRFLAFFRRTAGRLPSELSPTAEQALLAYDWPGNVRELRNAIERAAILWPAAVVEAEAFPARIAGARGSGPEIGGPHTLEEIERAHLEAVLATTPKIEDAAGILGIDPSTIWRKRKKQGS